MGKFGTREWAEVNQNIYKGCIHNCKYCYARYNACVRFKTIKDVNEWGKPVFRQKDFDEKPKLFKEKRIMYPTQHDITPEYIDKNIEYLRKWLAVGNYYLIVSKPHTECIRKICNELKEYKDHIVFRFTIGSCNDNVLKFWEPDAPSYMDRVTALKYAFYNGYETSVSCEPILDEDISYMTYELLPYITDTIWLGKMNFIKPRVDTSKWTKDDYKYLDKVNVVIEDEFIKDLYDEFKDNPKVKWKESIKKVLGLPEEDGVA